MFHSKISIGSVATLLFFGTAFGQYQKPSKADLKSVLTEMQYKVTQQDSTEPPFKNIYWDHKEPGLYVDIVTGEPLFSSKDKFDSGTGWPSFTQPLDPKFVRLKPDTSLLGSRTEVRSAIADSHLGHVFDDGPKPTGKRFCMNSASLRFVPASLLQSRGYVKYVSLFESSIVQQETIVLAGGCFWCMEPPFERIVGVSSVVSGFAGGTEIEPTYDQVSAGKTSHTEAVEVTFNPAQITFKNLVDVYLRQTDPTDAGGQFVDRGSQYRPAIFYRSAAEKLIIEKTMAAVKNKFPKAFQVQVVPDTAFYRAEDYHQDFYLKDPNRYYGYRKGSGRDLFLDTIWGKNRNFCTELKIKCVDQKK